MKSNLKLFSVLFSAAFLMLLTGCKDNPTDVAKKWHAATFKDGDVGEAMKYVSGTSMEDTTKKAIAELKAAKSTSFGDAKVDGDTATVRVTTKQGEDRKTKEFKLAKTEGKWLIISVKTVVE